MGQSIKRENLLKDVMEIKMSPNELSMMKNKMMNKEEANFVLKEIDKILNKDPKVIKRKTNKVFDYAREINKKDKTYTP